MRLPAFLIDMNFATRPRANQGGCRAADVDQKPNERFYRWADSKHDGAILAPCARGTPKEAGAALRKILVDLTCVRHTAKGTQYGDINRFELA
jgi:hypothetical protein